MYIVDYPSLITPNLISKYDKKKYKEIIDNLLEMSRKYAKASIVNITGNQFYQVYIGRGSIWGNPFYLGRDGTREEVIEKYRVYILNNNYLRNKLPELKGKILGCHCKPLPCHGDVLVDMINKL
jgi:hypothetical protein